VHCVFILLQCCERQTVNVKSLFEIDDCSKIWPTFVVDESGTFIRASEINIDYSYKVKRKIRRKLTVKKLECWPEAEAWKISRSFSWLDVVKGVSCCVGFSAV